MEVKNLLKQMDLDKLKKFNLYYEKEKKNGILGCSWNFGLLYFSKTKIKIMI